MNVLPLKQLTFTGTIDLVSATAGAAFNSAVDSAVTITDGVTAPRRLLQLQPVTTLILTTHGCFK